MFPSIALADTLLHTPQHHMAETIHYTPMTADALTASSLNVTGATGLGSTLTVTGATTIYDDFTVRADGGSRLFKVDKADGATTIAGTLDTTGDLSVNTDKFQVTAATGNTDIAGTLGVSGDTTLSSGADLIVTGTTTIYGTLYSKGGIDSNFENLTINNNLDVKVTASLDGIVVMQDSVMFGTRTLEDISASTTRDLLQITLPDVDNYIGIVNITYIADMSDNEETVSDLEIFSTEYLISRMDKTLTATIARITDDYYNISGGMSEPGNSYEIYAKSLNVDYTLSSLWVPDARTVTLQYLPPTRTNRKDINATVLYEIRSGGPATGVGGLWAR